MNDHEYRGTAGYSLAPPAGKVLTMRLPSPLPQENSIVLNGSLMFNTSRIPHSAGDVFFDEGMERYKLCMCADGTLFRLQVKYSNMGCQTSDNPCGH